MDFNLRSAKASKISNRLAGMIEEAETFYKLDEFLDLVEKDLMPSVEQVAGLGKIRRIKNEKIDFVNIKALCSKAVPPL
jgi:hypothetical protein